MSDQEIGKRLIEIQNFQLFLTVYNELTKGEMEIKSQPEKFPDFICQRKDRSSIEVEMTKIENSDVSHDSRVSDPYDRVDHDLIARIIVERIEEKSLRKPQILLLELYDGPLRELVSTLEAVFKPGSFTEYGFDEIWIADYSELDAYGEVSLFGMHPEKWWGYYESPNRNFKKQYG